MHRPALLPGIFLVLIFRGCVNPQGLQLNIGLKEKQNLETFKQHSCNQNLIYTDSEKDAVMYSLPASVPLPLLIINHFLQSGMP
jgi:hypothetical protein